MTDAEQPGLVLGRCDEVRWGREEWMMGWEERKEERDDGSERRRWLLEEPRIVHICLSQDFTFQYMKQWLKIFWCKSIDIFKKMCDGLNITQLKWEQDFKLVGKNTRTFASSFLHLSSPRTPPSSLSPLGWLCVAPWGFQWVWASLARPVSLDGIEKARVMHPDDGCSWTGTRERGGEEREVVSKWGRVG